MILHITTQNDWKSAQAQGEYRAASLETEGFIHCSAPEQALGPANSFYRGQTDLVLLVIDPARLKARLVYEKAQDVDMVFPHIYGPLNLDAVTGVVPFPPLPDGSFELPRI